MNNIKFSIAIPAYKKHFLQEAISSCMSQTYQNFELIIVDDCSPEDLKSIVNRFSDERIRYYRNKKNCGAIDVVDNWNNCLKYATGDYIICMGDDDMLCDDTLEQYVCLIKKYPDLGVYHAWTAIIDENSQIFKMQEPRPEWECCFSLAYNRWNRTQFIGDFCYEVQRLKQDGGFVYLPLAWGSDDITAVQAARYGGIANTQHIAFKYRENRYTISSTGNIVEKMNAILQEKTWYYTFINNNKELLNTEYDDIYRKCLLSTIELHYKDKMKITLGLHLGHKPLDLFYWLKNRKKYSLSILRILYSFRFGFENKYFHGK